MKYDTTQTPIDTSHSSIDREGNITHHPDPKLRPIKQINLAHGRVYDGPAGHLGSVTTVLRATQSAEDKQRLDDWRDRVGHEEAERIREAGAARGTQLHSDVEGYALHGLAADSPWFKSIRWAVDESERRQAIEQILYCPRYRFAGTVDMVANRGEFLAVWDWTTSGKPKKREYLHDKFLQASAYSIAWEEQTGQRADELIVAVALEDRPAQLFAAVLGEVDDLRAEWMARLARYLAGGI